MIYKDCSSDGQQHVASS